MLMTFARVLPVIFLCQGGTDFNNYIFLPQLLPSHMEYKWVRMKLLEHKVSSCDTFQGGIYFILNLRFSRNSHETVYTKTLRKVMNFPILEKLK